MIRVIVTKLGLYYNQSGRVIKIDGDWREVIMASGTCWLHHTDLVNLDE